MITGYTASCAVETVGTTAPALTNTGTVSPIVVTGLTNGSIYSCKVTATNSAGTGEASSAATVTPVAAKTAPGAPTLTSVTAAGSGTATVNAGQDPRLFAGEVSDLILG